jgi:mono/diheme cytochrome c family protein
MQKAGRTIDVPVQPVAYSTDPSLVERGRYLFESRGCRECHGAKGEGREFINDGGMYAKSPNIGTGAGSVVRQYTEIDWVRTIRHGVKPDKHPLMIMPSGDYNRMSDPDLAALVAYVRSLPATDGSAADVRFPLIARILYGFGQIPDPAELIDHTKPPSAPVGIGATVENGTYVAELCVGCHGPGYSGGKIPGMPPDWPPAANLTPGEGGAFGRYNTVDKFKAMMRTGKRPDGSPVNAAMPFETLRMISEIDLEALYMYLRTLPARAAGGR